jgi:phosphoribosylaminoimidazolecarboxamide formyltransferase / IMP cyclohydrolase
MNNPVQIKSALISVYYKEGLEKVVKKLHSLGVSIVSTGGTMRFIEDLNIPVTSVEALTSYPSILGGRVKTLHPKVFGGILSRRDLASDLEEAKKYDIPAFDLVIVDLYPFEETVQKSAKEEEIIEKIDVGGISLIRAAAKNFKDVLIVSSRDQYQKLMDILDEGNGSVSLLGRREFAREAFHISSHYDHLIHKYFSKDSNPSVFKESISGSKPLRYGENPHQKGYFFGRFEEMFEQLHGKEISYNNILDIDAAVRLIAEFNEPTVAILKHNNPCGLASRDILVSAWKDALAGDPISAFGGVIILNRELDKETAVEMDKIFFEIVIAPGYKSEAIEILETKKNRILLVQKTSDLPGKIYRSVLTGVLFQDADMKTETRKDMRVVTMENPSAKEYADLEFANKIVKHCKSNAIVLAANSQLLAAGVGQTSRVDALKHAIQKAQSFDFELNGAVLASDAFFPFSDSVSIAHEVGITAVIQPGGSVRDQETIDFCNLKKMKMVFTNIRHFKH